MEEHRHRRLLALYGEIHACSKCIGAAGCKMRPDPHMVARKVIDRALESEVFVIGQAPGGKTLRLSGIPYLTPAGALSDTGTRLDGFLKRFGYTIDPRNSRYHYAYSTDMIQSYPGKEKNGKRDRKPTSSEIANCAQWLHEELDIMLPAVVILHGSLARDFFPRYHPVRGGRSTQLEWGQEYRLPLGVGEASVFAVPHAAYTYTNVFDPELIYSETAIRISEVLRNK